MPAVELLLSKGAHINRMDKCFNTALMKAARKGVSVTFFALLQCGAEFTFRNIDEKTAFQLMAEDSPLREQFASEYLENGGIHYAEQKSTCRRGLKQKEPWMNKLNKKEWPF